VYVHVILTQPRFRNEGARKAIERHQGSWKRLTRGNRSYRRALKSGLSFVRSLHVEAHEDPSVTSWHVHTHCLVHFPGSKLEALEAICGLVEGWLDCTPGATSQQQVINWIEDSKHTTNLCHYLPEDFEFPSLGREIEAHCALVGVRMWGATGVFRGWRSKTRKSYEAFETGPALHRLEEGHPALLAFEESGRKYLKPRELDADGNPIGELEAFETADGDRYDPQTGEVLEQVGEDRALVPRVLIPGGRQSQAPRAVSSPHRDFLRGRPGSSSLVLARLPVARGPPPSLVLLSQLAVRRSRQPRMGVD
jgi:hypothetical protein